MQQFLVEQTADISIWGVVLNLALTAVLAFVLGRVYVTFGKALSNRRAFARNFVLLGMTTMLIITVVKSSLALSLGLVGALSIVRFRAAIKEPEELAYLFLVIALGLGFGADQRLVTGAAFAIIVAVICVQGYRRRSEDHQQLHLTVASEDPGAASLDAVVEVLRKHCPEVSLARFDESGRALEASFSIQVDDVSGLQAITSELRGLHESVSVRYLDPGGLGA